MPMFCVCQNQNGDWHEYIRANPMSENWYRVPYALADTQWVHQGCRVRNEGHNGYDMKSKPDDYEPTSSWCDMEGHVGNAITAAAYGVVRKVVDYNCCRNIPDTVRNNADSIIAICTNDSTFSINSIFIEHLNGEWSAYHHIAQNTATVSVGQIVNAGDIIAYEGEVGPASSVHLHFALYYGISISPDSFQYTPAIKSHEYFIGQRIPLMCNTKEGYFVEGNYRNLSAYDPNTDEGAIGSCGSLGCVASDTIITSANWDSPHVIQRSDFISAHNVKINPPNIEGPCNDYSEVCDDDNTCTLPDHFCAHHSGGMHCRNNGGSVVFRAGDHITLYPGFHAKSRSFFRAEIGGCQ